DVLSAARILGERPPLQRLLRNATPEALPPYLTRNCENAALDACAIVQNGELIATTTSDVDWKAVIVAAGEQGGRLPRTGAAQQTTLAGGSAAVVEHDGVSVLAVRRMNERLAARLGERAGLEIKIVDYASFVPGEGPLAVLNSDALSRGEPVAAYVSALGSYAASVPVAAPTGETVALLQALLPADKVMGP